MAKLPKAVAKRVNKAESSSSDFEALPEGRYTAKLNDVDTTKEGAKGAYWSWEFEIVDGEFKNRKLWVNTSLSEKADWKMKEVFTAFGYDADTDTDELVGEQVRLQVSQRAIESGPKKGDIGNNVDRVMPVGDDDDEEGDDVF